MIEVILTAPYMYVFIHVNATTCTVTCNYNGKIYCGSIYNAASLCIVETEYVMVMNGGVMREMKIYVAM